MSVVHHVNGLFADANIIVDQPTLEKVHPYAFVFNGRYFLVIGMGYIIRNEMGAGNTLKYDQEALLREDQDRNYFYFKLYLHI